MTEPKKITSETLKKWRACEGGAARFNELFPNGATLAEASVALIADGGHKGWSDWLWAKCSKDKDFMAQTFIIGGDYSTVTGGYHSIVTVGDHSNATGGAFGFVTGGEHSAVTGGYRSVVEGGYCSTVRGGHGSVLILRRWIGGKYTPHVAIVGQNGIKPNVFYRLNDKGEFVEAEQ